ncbi:uncharacterized protein LOC113215247 isoform X3 [Frankliniella occidentalis]|uniref:Uncharacterized protein LOC113215247 isoform X3 n=1 Tax=Frankliniella occidentalis TaxID=133901 RepID=A0A9C6X4U4_FRAOC|nr:uncharacterized protein LOC113215247 isoform X3 [Frankliniella occidentalis]
MLTRPSVLSIPDENSLLAVDNVENPQHQDTLVMHLADSLIRRLRSRGGVTCVSCKSDLFSHMAGKVNSLALQMRSGLLSELPSDKLLSFVKKAWEEFEQSWLSRLHEADTFQKLDLGPAAETDRIRVLNTKPVRTNVPEVAYELQELAPYLRKVSAVLDDVWNPEMELDGNLKSVLQTLGHDLGTKL